MNLCPLCHRNLAAASAKAFVPVSPIVYPGVEGLEVHADCLEAARRGEFEVPLPPGPIPAIAAALALLLLTITVLITFI